MPVSLQSLYRRIIFAVDLGHQHHHDELSHFFTAVDQDGMSQLRYGIGLDEKCKLYLGRFIADATKTGADVQALFQVAHERWKLLEKEARGKQRPLADCLEELFNNSSIG